MDDFPRRPGRPSSPLSRRALVVAAREVFATEGFAGATLDAIARRLDIRKPSLLHHFPSKDALYAEAVATLLEELSVVFASALGPAPFPERLDALSEALTRYLAKCPEAAALLLRELGGPRVGPPGAQAAVNLLRAAAAFLESAMRAGEIPARDPHQLALSIVGLHLVWFAVPAVTGELYGTSPFAPESVDRRVDTVRAQVRALCGLPSPS